MRAPLRIVLCACEPSGDALGAALMGAFNALDEQVTVSGCGGPLMTAAGLDSLFDIDPLSVVGPVDALKAVGVAAQCAWRIAQHAADIDADAVIFIDAWAFSRLAAGKTRKIAPQAKLIKYVAPQLWASRPKRIETLSRLFDHVISLFEFEAEWLEERGVEAICAGHSGYQLIAAAPSQGDEFRMRFNLGDEPLLLLAPGSRASEINHLAKPFREAADLLRAQTPNLRIAIPVVPRRAALVQSAFEDWPAAPIFVAPQDKIAAFQAATLGLCASGTISTELALCQTPMVVGYAGDWATAAWARHVMVAPWASLVNIAAGEGVIPEFIQEACTGPQLAEALAPLLITDSPARRAQLSVFDRAFARLGVNGAPAAARAAQIVVKWARGG